MYVHVSAFQFENQLSTWCEQTPFTIQDSSSGMKTVRTDTLIICVKCVQTNIKIAKSVAAYAMLGCVVKCIKREILGSHGSYCEGDCVLR